MLSFTPQLLNYSTLPIVEAPAACCLAWGVSPVSLRLLQERIWLPQRALVFSGLVLVAFGSLQSLWSSSLSRWGIARCSRRHLLDLAQLRVTFSSKHARFWTLTTGLTYIACSTYDMIPCKQARCFFFVFFLLSTFSLWQQLHYATLPLSTFVVIIKEICLICINSIVLATFNNASF